MAATAAAEKALVIPELLEAILMALPPLDVVVAQRVNQKFKNAIRDSPRIQRKLFYRPPSKDNSRSFAEVLNPLLSQFFKHFSIEAELYICDSRGQLVSRALHGIVSDDSNDICDSDEKTCIDGGDYVRLWLTPSGGGTVLSSPLPWHGSYAKMEISTLPIDVVIGSDGRGYRKIGWAEGSEVLTMRDVLEAFCRRFCLVR